MEINSIDFKIRNRHVRHKFILSIHILNSVTHAIISSVS